MRRVFLDSTGSHELLCQLLEVEQWFRSSAGEKRQQTIEQCWLWTVSMAKYWKIAVKLFAKSRIHFKVSDWTLRNWANQTTLNRHSETASLGWECENSWKWTHTTTTTTNCRLTRPNKNAKPAEIRCSHCFVLYSHYDIPFRATRNLHTHQIAVAAAQVEVCFFYFDLFVVVAPHIRFSWIPKWASD